MVGGGGWPPKEAYTETGMLNGELRPLQGGRDLREFWLVWRIAPTAGGRTLRDCMDPVP